ncbi:MAG: hypothetical protein ACKVPY_12740 [Paracoccaceae bacterium]
MLIGLILTTWRARALRRELERRKGRGRDAARDDALRLMFWSHG